MNTFELQTWLSLYALDSTLKTISPYGYYESIPEDKTKLLEWRAQFSHLKTNYRAQRDQITATFETITDGQALHQWRTFTLENHISNAFKDMPIYVNVTFKDSDHDGFVALSREEVSYATQKTSNGTPYTCTTVNYSKGADQLSLTISYQNTHKPIDINVFDHYITNNLATINGMVTAQPTDTTFLATALKAKQNKIDDAFYHLERKLIATEEAYYSQNLTLYLKDYLTTNFPLIKVSHITLDTLLYRELHVDQDSLFDYTTDKYRSYSNKTGKIKGNYIITLGCENTILTIYTEEDYTGDMYSNFPKEQQLKTSLKGLQFKEKLFQQLELLYSANYEQKMLGFPELRQKHILSTNNKK